jgi:hypothetical protein
LVETTLGFADTEADWIVPTADGGELPLDCTVTVWVFDTPPAVAVTSSGPVAAGAV